MSNITDSNKVIEAKTNYPLLVEQLLLLAKEFNACEGVINEIKSIKDYRSFRSAYKDSFEEVAEKFGIELNNESEDYEETINDLKNEVYSLQDELHNFERKYRTDNSMWDDLKIKHFLIYKNNYAEWELEELLRDGKKFLTNPNNLSTTTK